MATEETSRDAFEPRKRYAAVGMQQGRVLLDDDFNEAQRIQLAEERQVAIDVIGPFGTPDTGFLISNGHITNGGCDFDIAPGTLYVSGIRLWNPAQVTFALQDDWLQQTAADRPMPVEGRTDLVYIEACQVPVTAVEDAELFEVALGGPDSSTRLRTTWRVKLATDVDGSDCPAAWQTLVEQWQADGLGDVDEDFERVVDAELTVDFVAGTPGDLCTPSTASGYLGAENQTIRVELVDATHLTWGFDNGAPIYRAQIQPDNLTIKLLTDPRDQHHWPRAGQVVEILPWAAVLPNGEKVAEIGGELGRVAKSYDADGGTFELAGPLPANFGLAWMDRADHAALEPAYVFVRVWDRGDDLTSDPAILFNTIDPVPLGTTGLSVRITGDARVAGDHWIIAARPSTPNRVVPWELEAGRHVHGIRRFVAPLALIRWHRAGSFDLLHDCRPFFLPLTRLRGCCTHTVGDEVSSFGQFASIQEAIDALPPEGGKVCVLPGTYSEAVEVIDRENVTIEGCGARSKIALGLDAPWAILVLGGKHITICDLAFDLGDHHGVVIAGHNPGDPIPKVIDALKPPKNAVEHVRLSGLTMQVGGRAGIYALGGKFLEIVDCTLTVGPLESVIAFGSDLGKWPAIVSFADDVRIEGNTIIAPVERTGLVGTTTVGGKLTYTRTPLGGIQIGGGSQRVELRRNTISGGNGDGITLGSWAWAPAKLVGPKIQWAEIELVWVIEIGPVVTINDEGCIEVGWDPPDPPNNDPDLVPISMGAVTDLRIVDNTIERMGRSGIGVVRFFNLAQADQLIVTRRVMIENNRITSCLRLSIPPLPAAMREVAAAGVIVLADVEALVVRDNVLADNGKRHVDPICGVFALVSTGAVIERNRITDNAPWLDTDEPVRPGWRGGIVLPHALPPSTTVPLTFFNTFTLSRQSGEPTARIADNVVVVPEGRAVLVVGDGPISVVDNHLTSRGVGLADVAQLQANGNDATAIAAALAQGVMQTMLDLLGGTILLVLDNGTSNEQQLGQLVEYLSLAGQDLGPQPNLDPRPPVAASGQILVADNQLGLGLIRAPANIVASAVYLSTKDDAAFADNQVEIDRFLDRVIHSVRILGFSVRVLGNRVKDGYGTDASAAGLSIFSSGTSLNMTVNNQTTRCIVATGTLKTSIPNHVLATLYQPKACDLLIAPVAAFEAKFLDVVFAED